MFNLSEFMKNVNKREKFDDKKNYPLVVYENEQYMTQVDLLNEDVNNILNYIDISGHTKNRSDFLYV